MKIKILNDSGYYFLKKAKFPIEIDLSDQQHRDGVVWVPTQYLKLKFPEIGNVMHLNNAYPFSIDQGDVEVNYDL